MSLCLGNKATRPVRSHAVGVGNLDRDDTFIHTDLDCRLHPPPRRCLRFRRVRSLCSVPEHVLLVVPTNALCYVPAIKSSHGLERRFVRHTSFRKLVALDAALLDGGEKSGNGKVRMSGGGGREQSVFQVGAFSFCSPRSS